MAPEPRKKGFRRLGLRQRYLPVGHPVYDSAKYARACREETTEWSSPSWRALPKSSEPGTVCSMDVIQ